MKSTQRQRIKAWLLKYGSLTNVQAITMFQPGVYRLSERIRELQDEGMKIEGDFVRVDGKKTGTYRYTLLNKPPKMIAVVGPNGVRFVPEEQAAGLARAD